MCKITSFMALSDWQWSRLRSRPRPITSIQNSMGICVGICLCAVWTPSHNPIQPIFIGPGLGHCQSDRAIKRSVLLCTEKNVMSNKLGGLLPFQAYFFTKNWKSFKYGSTVYLVVFLPEMNWPHDACQSTSPYTILSPDVLSILCAI